MPQPQINIDSIFKLNSQQEFNEKALQIFHYQAENCPVYSEFISLLKINPKSIQEVNEIPFLPISLFKTHKVISGQVSSEAVFKSSGTGKTGRSQHFVTDLSVYEKSCFKGFSAFYSSPEDYVILGLLPSYLEQGDSSLVYMMDYFLKSNPHKESGLYLDNFEKLSTTLQSLKGRKVLLLGVTYAMLDFAEQFPQDLSHSIVMETGGMKGRRKELLREDLHNQLCKAFNVPSIHSEYGMTELLSQGYSRGNGLFNCPNWMKIQLRENTDPVYSRQDLTRGMINVIDLANVNSCSFIATQDLGRISENGFEVLGRTDHSDVRGCSQLTL